LACTLSGVINVYSEMAACFYFFSYSYVMKRKITSLTSGIQKSLIISNILSNFLPAIICLTLALFGGFGVSVRLPLPKLNNLGPIYLRNDEA
jgi:hypothetical protein